MTYPPLPRLTEQIIRNSIASNLGRPYTREVISFGWGVDEYFESWAVSFPYEGGPLLLHSNSAFSVDERNALEPLVKLLNEAWDATSGMSDEAFLATEWPDRIDEAARNAHALFVKRGKFREDAEEDEPSLTFQT